MVGAGMKTFGTIEQVRQLPVRVFPASGEVHKSIYALIDPRDRTVRYIGAAKNLRERFKQHRKQSNSPAVRRLVQELLEHDLSLQIETLAMPEGRYWDLCEVAWIRAVRGAFKLFNVSPGGEGDSIWRTSRARPKRDPEMRRLNMLDQLFDDDWQLDI
jgi:hypothetical protein